MVAIAKTGEYLHPTLNNAPQLPACFYVLFVSTLLLPFSVRIGLSLYRTGEDFHQTCPRPRYACPCCLSLMGSSGGRAGSGKTCGFLLPGMLHINATRKDPRMGPTVLVLAPTRELAVQIKEEADKFGRSSGIRNTCVTLPDADAARSLSLGAHADRVLTHSISISTSRVRLEDQVGDQWCVRDKSTVELCHPRCLM